VIRLFPERGGWLEVVCGPMFSGKSEELIRRLRRAEIAGQRALIVKPRIDDRYDIGHVVSHAGAKMRAVAVSRPEEIPGLAEAYDVIGIDEVQFFTPSIVLAIEVLVERGTRVVVSGLDQDFRGLPFGSMPELLCRAELVDKLQAVCHRCGGPATMTQRLVDGRPAAADGATIVVGALDSYESSTSTAPPRRSIRRTATAAPRSRSSLPRTTGAAESVTGVTSITGPRTTTPTSSSPPCRRVAWINADTPRSTASTSVEIVAPSPSTCTRSSPSRPWAARASASVSTSRSTGSYRPLSIRAASASSSRSSAISDEALPIIST
jgi:thymidine kinase